MGEGRVIWEGDQAALQSEELFQRMMGQIEESFPFVNTRIMKAKIEETNDRKARVLYLWTDDGDVIIIGGVFKVIVRREGEAI